MRIFQVLTTMSFGDAVSNDTLAISKLLASQGIDCMIYAENIDKKLASDKRIRTVNKLPKLNADDIMIYHLSTGTELNSRIKSFPCRKYLIYHNITPANYFSAYSGIAARLCSKGREEARSLKDTFEAGICDSEYNMSELREMGYTCPLSVRPILIPFEDYDREPDSKIIGKYKDDGYKNVVFVGRIAPNKKQEDLISMMHYYGKMFDDKVRLFIVGSPKGMENYDERLRDYADMCKLVDVVFTGQVSFPSILAYYKIADAFVCMSEHEGFCVPLTEAMHFNVPILAKAAAAVPGTLNGSGILFDGDLKKAAFYLHEILYDEALRQEIIKGQRERLSDFSYENVAKIFMDGFNKFIKGEVK